MTFAEKLKSITKKTDHFSTPDSENVIEHNGMKSELVIYTK